MISTVVEAWTFRPLICLKAELQSRTLTVRPELVRHSAGHQEGRLGADVFKLLFRSSSIIWHIELEAIGRFVEHLGPT